MGKNEELKPVSLYGSGIIEVNYHGGFTIDGKEIGCVLAKHFGVDADNEDYDDRYKKFYGVVTVKVTPYPHKELGVIDDDF